MFEIWDKVKIASLTIEEKEQWFEVLNYKLEEDRGISRLAPDLCKQQQIIKDDYVKYIESCAEADKFYKYYIMKVNKQIVAVCRINIYADKYFLEGLQTHHDYYRQGYATDLLNHMLHTLKVDEIQMIYAEVRKWNDPSNQLHHKFGFELYGEEDNNYLYRLHVNQYIQKKLFDQWSKSYTKSVKQSEQENTYPFAGYSEVKYQVINKAMQFKKGKVLDMGVGTGEISSPLYDLGFNITGVDMSNKMISTAKEKMPKAIFIQGEFKTVVSKLKEQFDAIIITYAIHHLTYEQQIELLTNLKDVLTNQGIMIIGDVSQMNQRDMAALRYKYEAIWDDEEYYPIYDIYKNSVLDSLFNISYEQVNEVAGIYTFKEKR